MESQLWKFTNVTFTAPVVPKFLWCCDEVKPCVAGIVHAYIGSSKKMHDPSRNMLCRFVGLTGVVVFVGDCVTSLFTLWFSE